MPHNSQRVSEAIPKEALGSLGACLVEGDPEQRNRERRVRRRSLIVSIATQAVIVALLILLPLFGKSERIALAISTPIPPYSPYKGPSRDVNSQPMHGQRQNVCRFCFSHFIPHTIVTHDPTGDASDDAVPDGAIPGMPGGGPGTGLIPIPDGRANVPPPPPDRHVARPSILRMTQLDPAMLIHRVDPLYPNLPKQMHKEGRVELRAIIATDGSIKSLEVVGGDPMFYQSALDAVSQWHYKPTILNGQPVEIDTHITVIYTMPR
jgi:protein TonB